MQAQNPIVNANPITQENPVAGENPIQSPVIIGGADQTQDYDISCGCSASVPPSERALYMKMVAITMLIGSGIAYGLYMLAQYLGWMP